jgi:hypothetical protein
VSVFTGFLAGVAAVTAVGCVINVRMQYTRLDTRHGTRVSQLMFAPGGIRVRVWLLVATGVAMPAAAGSVAWPVVAGVWFGLVAWEAGVQATAWIRRVRQRRSAAGRCS